MFHQTRLAIVVALTLSACLSTSRSQLQHEDRPEERGADNAEPWHFHTGKGKAQIPFEDQRTGKTTTKTVSCDPRSTDATAINCMERVYFFAPEDIKKVVNRTKQVLEKIAQNYQKDRDLQLVVMGAALTTAYLSTAAPDVTVSKVGALILIGVVGVTYVLAVRADMSLRETLTTIANIDTFMESEENFVRQCRHVRKDFLSRASAFGIVFDFPLNGGQFIPAKDFQATRASDLALYDKTRAYAREHNTNTADAFNQFFRNQCGQLPMVDLEQEDVDFMNPENVVPLNTMQRLADVNEVLQLKSGKHLNLSAFSSDDLRDASQIESIDKFLINFRSDLQRFAEHGDTKTRDAIGKFRNSFDEVTIQPISAYVFTPPAYKIVEQGGVSRLVIHAVRKGYYYSSYSINLKEVYTKAIGLTL